MEKRDKNSNTLKAISVIQKETEYVDLLQRLVDFGNTRVLENFDMTLVLLEKAKEPN